MPYRQSQDALGKVALGALFASASKSISKTRVRGASEKWKMRNGK